MKWLSGSFSFCLPGLGQLYTRHYLKAFIFFLVFCILELNRSIGGFVPFLAVAAALEAFLNSGAGVVTNSRTYSFATVAAVGLLLWVLAFGPFVIPLEFH